MTMLVCPSHSRRISLLTKCFIINCSSTTIYCSNCKYSWNATWRSKTGSLKFLTFCFFLRIYCTHFLRFLSAFSNWNYFPILKTHYQPEYGMNCIIPFYSKWEPVKAMVYQWHNCCLKCLADTRLLSSYV